MRSRFPRRSTLKSVSLLPRLSVIAVTSGCDSQGCCLTRPDVQQSVPQPAGIARAFAGRLMDMNGLAGAMGHNLMPLTAGLLVAILAFYLFNDFSTQLRAFDVEMQNTSSELVDYFARRIELVRR